VTENTQQAPALSRRHLLAGAGAIGAALVASACGADTSRSVSAGAPGRVAFGPGAPTQPTPTRAPTPEDVSIAQLAAGLEVLAVRTYKAALDAATAGKLGAVPPAVAEFVTTAGKHHQEHLDAWNQVLTSNGAAAVTTPNAELKPTVDQAFAGVTDVGGAAALALMLEQIAAATYLSAQGVLTDKAAIDLAGSIQVVDAQHVSVLLFALGEYPVPDTFAKIDQAASPSGGAAPGQMTDDGAFPSTL
jgi:hypothetical protein